MIQRISLYSAMAVVFGTAVACSSAKQPTITQEELVRRTQELLEAVAGGDQSPWKKYFAENSMFFDERGRSMDKAALVKDVAPLPPGYSGSIRIANPHSRILADTAILSYDMDETEAIFGQEMKARYHATDTWIRRNDEWQIVAGLVLRYYEDPSPSRAEPSKCKDYAGTYELSPGNTVLLSINGLNLYSQRTGRPKDLLVPEAPGIFFRKGIEGRRLFRRTAAGKVDALIDRRNNGVIVWKKIS